MKKLLCIVMLAAVLFVSGCGSGEKMKDGFYTAEMSEGSFGWQEYLCIMVKNNTIVYAEFNAKDPSGYIKAWDNSYMKNMLPISGTYPNEYTRNYVEKLLNNQDASGIDALTGATSSVYNFNELSKAVIEQAMKGDSSTAWVDPLQIASEEE